MSATDRVSIPAGNPALIRSVGDVRSDCSWLASRILVAASNASCAVIGPTP